jgi:trans-aconitate methyltransferase
MPREWDAAAYDRLSDPQYQWGLQTLDRADLSGAQLILDAGCGAGRVTAALLERAPASRVVAVDLSRNMLAQAQARLAGPFKGRVSLFCADLSALALRRSVDLVFSTAVFHWIPDHRALFSRLFEALRPGGRLVAHCGGGPNLRRLRTRADALMHQAPFADWFRRWTPVWEYANPEETRTRLAEAGFVDVEAWLQEAPTRLPDAETFHRFNTAVTLRHHVSYLPTEALRAQFIDVLTDLAARDAPPFELDYWRLNLSARRPA